MFNMMKMDFRRMLKSKMFYIAFLCMAAAILFTVITLRTVTDPELRQQAIDKGMEITTTDQEDFQEVLDMTWTEALCSSIYTGGFYSIIVSVIAVLFVCSDFGGGFAKNIFSYQGKRWQYVVSKLVCMAVVCLLWILGTFVVFEGICRAGQIRFSPASPMEYGMFVGGYVLIGMAYAAQAIFISLLTRSEGAGIGASIVVAGGLVAVLLEAFLGNWGISVMKYTLYGSLQDMESFLVDKTPAAWMISVILVWLAVWAALGIWSLKKKDI